MLNRPPIAKIVSVSKWSCSDMAVTDMTARHILIRVYGHEECFLARLSFEGAPDLLLKREATMAKVREVDPDVSEIMVIGDWVEFYSPDYQDLSDAFPCAEDDESEADRQSDFDNNGFGEAGVGVPLGACPGSMLEGVEYQRAIFDSEGVHFRAYCYDTVELVTDVVPYSVLRGDAS